MNDQDQLNKFLTEQKYMTIAVTLDDGTPWATPVRIQLQWGTVFEWDSKTDTEHSKAIAKRPTVAISMYTSEIQFGFYAQAMAELVGEPNEHGVGRYRATVIRSWVNDATFVKREVELA